MNLRSGKPAIKSMGILGGVGSLVGILGIVTEIRTFIAANPDLIDETKLSVLAVVTAVGALVSVIGRWRAVVPIKGLLKTRK